MAVWQRGSGAPVICLPGYPDHAIGLLSTLERLAAAGLRGIAISYPGYWPSAPVPDGDYSMEAVARDLVAVMDGLEIERAHLLGHGWGALYGYFLGSHHPERLRSLVALAAPHPAGFAVRHSIVAEQQTAAYAMLLAYSSVGRELALDRRWLTSLAQSWSPGLYRSDWPDVLACLTRPEVADAVVEYYRADLTGQGAQTGSVAVPTTVIHGGQTGCIRPATFSGLERWFSAGLETHFLPRAGHWVHLEEPETTLALALAAMEGAKSGRATRGAGEEAAGQEQSAAGGKAAGAKPSAATAPAGATSGAAGTPAGPRPSGTAWEAAGPRPSAAGGARPEPTGVAARADVAVWELGPRDGRPVLLVHGFPDHAVGMLPFAERLAARGLRVVVPALPGYAASAPPPDADYSLSAVAGDLEVVMESLGLDAVAVVGHDWGAALAYQLAGSRRVSRIVAISAPHPRAFGLRRRVLAEQQSAAYAVFLAYSPRGPEVGASERWLTELSHAWSPALYREDWPEVLRHLTASGVPEAVCAYYRADLDGAGDPCGPIRVPATVIYGGQDGCLRPTLYAGAERHFDGPVTQHQLAEMGHWPHLESPDEVERIVLEALSRG